MTKKFINKNAFLCHNLNCDYLTKNLVIFKIWEWVRDGKF